MEEDTALAAVTAVLHCSCEGLARSNGLSCRNCWQSTVSFTSSPEGTGQTHLVQYTIKLRTQRLPLARQGEVLREMQPLEVTCSDDSEKRWRMAVLCRLEAAERSDKEKLLPLPRVYESLDLVPVSMWLSSLNLKSFYWQVALAKTAFSMGNSA